MQQARPFIHRAARLALLIFIALAAYWLGRRHAADFAPAPNSPSSATSESIPPESPPLVQTDEDHAPELPSEREKRPPLFDRIERATSPAAALAMIMDPSVSEAERHRALREFAVHSIRNSSALSANEIDSWIQRVRSITGHQYGLDVELGMALAEAKVSPSILQVWMDNYATHPGRSLMFASMLGQRFAADPVATLNVAATWTPWERSHFERESFRIWASEDPETALDWYARNRDSVDDDVGNQILETVSRSFPELATGLLPSIQNPEQRGRIIETIATHLAHKGTERAISWANSLENVQERDAAVKAVYQATPRGIGAITSRQDGFPVVQKLVPGGPLEKSGIQPGDLIVQAREKDSQPIDLYGMQMGEFVGVLRGEPGSQVEVRVLRRNQETGQLEEMSALITRDVLVIQPAQEE